MLIWNWHLLGKHIHDHSAIFTSIACNLITYYARIPAFVMCNIRFGKLGKTQGKPCCNSKSMGIDFPQPIFMSNFEKNWNFLAT